MKKPADSPFFMFYQSNSRTQIRGHCCLVVHHGGKVRIVGEDTYGQGQLTT